MQSYIFYKDVEVRWALGVNDMGFNGISQRGRTMQTHLTFVDWKNIEENNFLELLTSLQDVLGGIFWGTATGEQIITN